MMSHSGITLVQILHDLLADGPRSVASLVEPMSRHIKPEQALHGRNLTIHDGDDLGDLIWRGRAAKIIRMCRCSKGFDVEGKGPTAIVTSVPTSMGYPSVPQPREPTEEELRDPNLRRCQNCGRPMTGMKAYRKNCSGECRRTYANRLETERKRAARKARSG